MHVVVCGKVIPDSSVTLEIDPDAKRMRRTDVPHELDPAAASALEEALRLTEQHGGSVTFVTMGIPDASVGIRRALAMGASAAVHLLDDAFAGSDTLGTAKALAAAIRQQPRFDLVVCATESSDSYSGIVPVQVATLLGVPALTFAKQVFVDGETVTIHRQSEEGYAVVTAALPALVTTTSGINEPRYPQLKGIMAARKIEIQQRSAADLSLGPDDVGDSAARERVLSVGAPPSRGAGRLIHDEGDGGREIADFLAQAGVI
ncbi:MAG: electron transfer flavoprotein subunit alpha [Chloroflexi bacterium]|nr:electron transfer flavoprotein subunit alpha [Chloroflexota bacterium]